MMRCVILVALFVSTTLCAELFAALRNPQATVKFDSTMPAFFNIWNYQSVAPGVKIAVNDGGVKTGVNNGWDGSQTWARSLRVEKEERPGYYLVGSGNYIDIFFDPPVTSYVMRVAARYTPSVPPSVRTVMLSNQAFVSVPLPVFEGLDDTNTYIYYGYQSTDPIINVKIEGGSGALIDDIQFNTVCPKATGYKFNPATPTVCLDVDECSGTNPCGTNQKCINLVGSYSCACDNGYVVDARNNTGNLTCQIQVTPVTSPLTSPTGVITFDGFPASLPVWDYYWWLPSVGVGQNFAVVTNGVTSGWNGTSSWYDQPANGLTPGNYLSMNGDYLDFFFNPPLKSFTAKMARKNTFPPVLNLVFVDGTNKNVAVINDTSDANNYGLYGFTSSMPITSVRVLGNLALVDDVQYTTFCTAAGYNYNATTRTCQDVNECVATTSPCSSSMKCVNTVGSYKCVCTNNTIAINGVCVSYGAVLSGPLTDPQNTITFDGFPATMPVWGYFWWTPSVGIGQNYAAVTSGAVSGWNGAQPWYGLVNSTLPGNYLVMNSDYLDMLFNPPLIQFSAKMKAKSGSSILSVTFIDGTSQVIGSVSSLNSSITNQFAYYGYNSSKPITNVKVTGPSALVDDVQFITVCPSGTWVHNATTGECSDVDECASNTHKCSSLATCSNTPGSYDCQCNAGYAGNGFNCTDINECQSNPCPSPTICVNTVGSFKCDCPFPLSWINNNECGRLGGIFSGPIPNPQYTITFEEFPWEESVNPSYPGFRWLSHQGIGLLAPNSIVTRDSTTESCRWNSFTPWFDSMGRSSPGAYLLTPANRYGKATFKFDPPIYAFSLRVRNMPPGSDNTRTGFIIYATTIAGMNSIGPLPPCDGFSNRYVYYGMSSYDYPITELVFGGDFYSGGEFDDFSYISTVNTTIV